MPIAPLIKYWRLFGFPVAIFSFLFMNKLAAWFGYGTVGAVLTAFFGSLIVLAFLFIGVLGFEQTNWHKRLVEDEVNDTLRKSLLTRLLSPGHRTTGHIFIVHVEQYDGAFALRPQRPLFSFRPSHNNPS